MNIVILGASGQIGSVIRNALTASHNVTGTSRKQIPGLVQFDPSNEDWSVLGKPDVVINCVGQIVPESRRSFYAIHVDVTRRILKNRNVLGNPRIIQISALGATAAHQVDFLRTKGIADDILLKHRNTVVVRPSIVCTPGTMVVRKMHMLSRVARSLFGLLPVPRGFVNTRLQPVMPHDLADLVNVLCSNSHEGIVCIGGSEKITFREIIDLMAKSVNTRIRLLEIPRIVTDAAITRMIGLMFPDLINVTQYRLLFEDNVTDTTEAERLLSRRLASSRNFFKNEFSHASN
jgi:nucleoside-diphosphate-sugar epimerase